MSKTPYRILSPKFIDHGIDAGWEFDETEYETAEAAYADAIKRYPKDPIRIVKLCMVTDNS
jgi:hypothetical protein